MEFLYRTGVRAYHLGVRVAARFGNKQAEKWIGGREAPVDLEPLTGRPVIWMHAASLGEFEQGRPVLRALRKLRPEAAVLLTFFSPSGYERCKDTELADVVAYLPADSPHRAKEWVDRVRPNLAIFVKYEFWYYHLAALQAAGVATVLVAGTFRPQQVFFRASGGWWRKMLHAFKHLYVQTEADAALLRRHGIARVTVTGDPRIDRTAALAVTDFTDPLLAAFTAGHPTLLAGSVWEPDVAALAVAWKDMPDNWRLVLAPHQLQEDEIEAWKTRFSAGRYTAGETDRRVLILDIIGILSRAYRYGNLAYVGGGFRSGLHSTLEPMSYGLPVIFGPRYHKFPEATEAVRRGGAFSVSGGEELKIVLKALLRSENRENATAAQLAYVRENTGAGQRTAELIVKLTQPG